MRIFPLIFGIVLAGHATGAAGATSYTVRVRQKSESKEVSVTADHGRIRAISPPPATDAVVAYDSLLFTDGSPVIALNSQNQTWYELEPVAPFALRSFLLGVAVEKPMVRNVTLRFEETAGATLPEHHYGGQLAYDVHATVFGEKVKVHCVATLEVTTTESVGRDAWLGRVLPLTPYPAVDQKLSEAEATIKGFPMRSLMTVSRQYEGGAPMTDFVQVDALDVHQTEAPNPSLFERPEGYIHQKPVYGVPGT